MTRRFRKRPIIIEAIQLRRDNLINVEGFLGEARNYPECKIGGIDPATGQFMIKTLEGDMVASIGDWIIKGVVGEFYPCKHEIFEATYEEVME